MMKTHYLCPVYWKWLQLHPDHARQHREQICEAAMRFADEGMDDKALDSNGQAYEVAQAVLLSLRQPDTCDITTKQDIAIFASLAIQLARKHAANACCQQACEHITSAQQQLHAIAPLFACHHDMLILIHTIEHSLANAASFYERQQIARAQLH